MARKLQIWDLNLKPLLFSFCLQKCSSTLGAQTHLTMQNAFSPSPGAHMFLTVLALLKSSKSKVSCKTEGKLLAMSPCKNQKQLYTSNIKWHRGNSPILKGKNKVIEGVGPKHDRNLAGQTLCSVDLHLASGHMVMRCGTQRALWPSWLPATWPLSWAVSACCL